uniref:Uncharacterized protein n=1 Tax=Ditylenchus dipsaci TaxID=166011 RepID=A0A915EDE7_9BILA
MAAAFHVDPISHYFDFGQINGERRAQCKYLNCGVVLRRSRESAPSSAPDASRNHADANDYAAQQQELAALRNQVQAQNVQIQQLTQTLTQTQQQMQQQTQMQQLSRRKLQIFALDSVSFGISTIKTILTIRSLLNLHVSKISCT